jgi:hypothetical protein
MGTVVGITRHHTGTLESYKPTDDYPTYQVVKEGRAGLANSLSAFGLGRHRAIYVFSEDVSWHAGEWSYAGITDGNGHFLGIEAEGTGRWTDWQLDIYPRLCASILLFIGEGVDMMPRHADGAMPRGRKTDAANLPADFAATVARYLAHPELIPVNATPTPAIDPRGPEMRVLRVKGTGRIYTATDLEVVYVKDPAVSGVAEAVWGQALEVSQRQVDVLSYDANARRARQRAEVVAEVLKGLRDATPAAGATPAA